MEVHGSPVEDWYPEGSQVALSCWFGLMVGGFERLVLEGKLEATQPPNHLTNPNHKPAGFPGTSKTGFCTWTAPSAWAHPSRPLGP